MRFTAALAVLVLAAACAGLPPADLSSELHADYAKLRPVMLALRVESAERGLRRELYRALIDLRYSVLVPGEPVGTEAGVFRVRDLTDSPPRTVEGRMESPTGEVLYRMTVRAAPESARELALQLLRHLPPK